MFKAYYPIDTDSPLYARGDDGRELAGSRFGYIFTMDYEFIRRNGFAGVLRLVSGGGLVAATRFTNLPDLINHEVYNNPNRPLEGGGGSNEEPIAVEVMVDRGRGGVKCGVEVMSYNDGESIAIELPPPDFSRFLLYLTSNTTAWHDGESKPSLGRFTRRVNHELWGD